jgi:hypothetical protein
MRLDEIVAGSPLLEMAYAQKKAESIITGLEKPINDHLLKLWTMPSSEYAAHWMTELSNWIDEVSEIVLKPKNRRPTANFYYRILFDEPFGGAELPNITSRLKRIQRQGYTLTTNASPADLLARLQKFHTEFAHLAAQSPVSEEAFRGLLGDLS